MTNPFEQETGRFVVLRNDERQYSLWPAYLDVPAGWAVVLDEHSRKECLDYVSAHWTDMRPASLSGDR